MEPLGETFKRGDFFELSSDCVRFGENGSRKIQYTFNLPVMPNRERGRQKESGKWKTNLIVDCVVISQSHKLRRNVARSSDINHPATLSVPLAICISDGGGHTSSLDSRVVGEEDEQ